ncbi:MAG: hypothetical protein HYU36_05140 [Planctomycetes bacterium]|nr:hypothetical protein [Planctomycetota bacterium]
MVEPVSKLAQEQEGKMGDKEMGADALVSAVRDGPGSDEVFEAAESVFYIGEFLPSTLQQLLKRWGRGQPLVRREGERPACLQHFSNC